MGQGIWMIDVVCVWRLELTLDPNVLMSFFGFQENNLEEERQRIRNGGSGANEDVAVYTWGEESYDGLGDALQEGGDDFNDETFGGTGSVGEYPQSFLSSICNRSQARTLILLRKQVCWNQNWSSTSLSTLSFPPQLSRGSMLPPHDRPNSVRSTDFVPLWISNSI